MPSDATVSGPSEMSGLRRRIDRLNGGRLVDERDISRLTDAQLETLICSELARRDPALAQRYAVADPGERSVILKKVT